MQERARRSPSSCPAAPNATGSPRTRRLRTLSSRAPAGTPVPSPKTGTTYFIRWCCSGGWRTRTGPRRGAGGSRCGTSTSRRRSRRAGRGRRRRTAEAALLLPLLLPLPLLRAAPTPRPRRRPSATNSKPRGRRWRGGPGRRTVRFLSYFFIFFFFVFFSFFSGSEVTPQKNSLFFPRIPPPPEQQNNRRGLLLLDPRLRHPPLRRVGAPVRPPAAPSPAPRPARAQGRAEAAQGLGRHVWQREDVQVLRGRSQQWRRRRRRRRRRWRDVPLRLVHAFARLVRSYWRVFSYGTCSFGSPPSSTDRFPFLLLHPCTFFSSLCLLYLRDAFLFSSLCFSGGGEKRDRERERI